MQGGYVKAKDSVSELSRNGLGWGLKVQGPQGAGVI